MLKRSRRVKTTMGGADERTMCLVDPSFAAALEKRCLPGFQGVTAITADGTIAYLSPSLDGRFGVDTAGAVGRSFLEFVDLADAGQAIDSFGGVLAQPGFHPAIELRVGNGGDYVVIDAVAENRLGTELGMVVMHIADARDRTLASHLLSAQADVMRAIALGDSLATGLASVTGFVATALPGFSAVAYVLHDGRYVGHGDGLAAERRVVVERALRSEPRYVGAAALVDAEPKLAQATEDCQFWPVAGPVVGDGVASIWSVPIRSDRAAPVAGCLEVYGPDAVRPRDEHWIVLQLVSRLAAIAVEHAAMQAQLEREANVDPLTAVSNRRVITARLADSLGRGDRLVVCFIDLDHLKVVNDGLGHDAGDQVIAAAADRLQRAVGAGGAVGRFGGDEFVVIADGPGVTAEQLGEACLAAFAEPVMVAGRHWQLSASVGVVEVDTQTSPGEVLRDADAAMYEAKRAGRGRWVRFASSTRVSVVRRMRLEQQLRAAIELGEAQGWVQPIVRCADWSLLGVEVLARWQLASGEWIPPSDFVPLAEEIGVIDELGVQMIDAALAARSLLRAQGFRHAFTSVNLSPVQLRSDRLLRRLRGPDGISWQGLQLEMTEQRIVDDSAATLADLERVLGFGVELAIDDFGTGYSSLGALHRIPARTLKVDRSLVARSGTEAGRAVISAVVGVANAFGMTTVGEGVELADQARVLRDLGVDAVQGFLFARPAPLDEFARRIIRGGWVWDATAGELDAPHGLHVTVP